MILKNYKSGDEEYIIDLFSKSFGKSMSIEFWKWRFLENPFSDSMMINLMWDNDKLVGHLAVSTVELEIGDNKIPTALAMTGMTHPDYSGRGIFSRLAENLYRQITEIEKVEAIWGFPNLNSHYVFIKKLQWKNIGLIATLRLSQIHFSSFQLSNYQIADSFKSIHSNCIKQFKSGSIGVNKTVKYLNWRYTNNPINEYFIVEFGNLNENNFVVVKVFDSFVNQGFKEIDIMEHGYSNSPEIVNLMIGSILSFAKDKSIKLFAINTWMSYFDPRHILLELNKFKFDLPITSFICRPFGSLSNEMLNLNKWDITMGDSDIF